MQDQTGAAGGRKFENGEGVDDGERPSERLQISRKFLPKGFAPGHAKQRGGDFGAQVTHAGLVQQGSQCHGDGGPRRLRTRDARVASGSDVPGDNFPRPVD